MKIRIKFAKYGLMKFIGHLDMMRYFQKAMRRADIDIAYSKGFSPHQIMSFAAPLGVGIISSGEYLDIEVHSTRSSEESLRALNEAMVEGVHVLEYRALPEGAKNSMSLVAAADYAVTFKDPDKNPFHGQIPSEIIEDFYHGQKEIQIIKQTKKSERVMDLKPLIYEFRGLSKEDEANASGIYAKDEADAIGFFLRVCSGSTDNVKPELVLTAFADYCRERQICDFHFESADIQIHRLEVYALEKDTFVPLGELGQDIL